MNLTSLLALLCACAIAASAILFNRYQAATDRAVKAEAALATEKANGKIVTRYVDRVVEVERTRHVVGSALVRLCESAGMQRPGDPDEAAAANPNNGPTLEGLAADVIACRLNSDQLAAIQEVIKSQ